MHFLIANLLVMLTVTSCSRNEVPDNTQELNDYTSLKVDGTEFIDDIDGGGFISASGWANISGDFSNSTIAISFPGATATGTYTLSSGDGDFAGYTVLSPAQTYSLANAGSWFTVEITEIYAGTLSGMKGTFEGELYNAAGDHIVITEGKFEDH